MAVYREISEKETGTLVAIADECFGPGYIPVNQVKLLLLSNNPPMGVFVGNTLVGFCLLTRIISPNNNTFPEIPLVKWPIPSLVIKTLAIGEHFQNKGFGSFLVQKTIASAKNSSQPVFYPAWNENFNPAFTKKIKKLGFKVFATQKNYWYHSSIEKNFRCKRCGEPPCNCSVAFYIKNP
jgi:ribosomal protein S18 acetylase RimI-like enzyme